jgi:hypothetical protein
VINKDITRDILPVKYPDLRDPAKHPELQGTCSGYCSEHCLRIPPTTIIPKKRDIAENPIDLILFFENLLGVKQLVS